MRIRDFLNNKIELTIKIPFGQTSDNSHISIKSEETLVLFNIDVEKMLNDGFHENKEIFDFLYERINNIVNIRCLSIVGKLETYRELYLIEDIEDFLNIDINKYFDILDYEIEWESKYLIKCNKLLLDMFNNLNIKYMDDATSKNDRFIERLLS